VNWKAECGQLLTLAHPAVRCPAHLCACILTVIILLYELINDKMDDLLKHPNKQTNNSTVHVH